MLVHPNFDPVAVAIGPLAVHWYGLMYLAGFAAAWWLAQLRAKRPDAPVTRAQIDDLIFYAALGVVLGGRLGYVLFYNFGQFLQQPLWLFKVWQGGMSFHGGLLGVMLAMFLFARSRRIEFGRLLDFVAPLVPIGLGLGRLGNFIGQELWGRPTDVPWAMLFPRDPSQLPRHPSQLYQFALEGVLLFAIVWCFSRRPRPTWAVGGLFALCYGIFRFVVEFYRQPDSQIGLEAFGWMSRGQELSLPVIAVGAAALIYAYTRRAPASA